MRASRILRTAIPPEQGFLIPPRTTFDRLGSAAKGTVSLLQSGEKRDELLETINKGTIRPDVLGNSYLGIGMTVSLYNDLENPLLKENGFNADQFLEGVKPALESFHDIQGSLRNKFREMDGANVGKEELEEGEEEQDKTKEKANKEDEKGEKLSVNEPAAEKGPGELEEAISNLENAFQGTLTAIDRLKHWDWIKEAKEDKESLPAFLSQMVTPEFFGAIQSDCAQSYMLEQVTRRSFTYLNDSTEVTGVSGLFVIRCPAVHEGLPVVGTCCYPIKLSHIVPLRMTLTIPLPQVALLSARTAYKYPEDDTVDNDIFHEKLVEDELSVPKEDESRIPLVAQVEVLYDVKQTIVAKTLPEDTISTNDDSKDKEKTTDGDKAGDEDDDDDEDEEEEINGAMSYVGVLEGWLRGDPEGNKEIRWKLAHIRRPWEFPEL